MQKTILFATDGSANANACSRMLAVRTVQKTCQIHVVAVYDNSPVHLASRLDPNEAESLVAQAVKELIGACPSCKVTGQAVEGRSAAIILKLAAQLSADHIFMGAHSRHGAMDMFIGSVAAEVVRRALCSVTLVRSSTEIQDTDKVLVCIDNTEISSRVVQAITEYSWRKGGQFLLLNVLETAGYAESENPKKAAELFVQYMADERLRMEHLLDEQRLKLCECLPTNTFSKLIVYDLGVEDAILSSTKSHQINHIVLGTHDRGGMDKFWLGSISEAVSKVAPCSVSIIRQRK